MIKKLKKFWDSLPKEIKVLIYVATSGAGASIYYYLKTLEIETTTIQGIILAGLINIGIVFLQTRIPQVKERLNK